MKLLSLLFRKRLVQPVPIDAVDVEAAPPPNEEIERERVKLGLIVLREGLLTSVATAQLQERLAAGALLELRGGKP